MSTVISNFLPLLQLLHPDRVVYQTSSGYDKCDECINDWLQRLLLDRVSVWAKSEEQMRFGFSCLINNLLHDPKKKRGFI